MLTDKQLEILNGHSRFNLKKSKENYENPYSDRLYIGVIKFYDNWKGFGYIASNNCGMDRTSYEQDFYVDSSSFKEESAKTNHKIVVFQWKCQTSGKSIAYNVRNYSKEEDKELGLRYFGEYEEVQLKEKRINMFKYFGIPREVVLPLLKEQIASDENRTPKSTCKKIKSVIDRYKIEFSNKKRYIFSEDYESDKRTLWEELFSILYDSEWLELLNEYPPIVLYISKQELIKKWIKRLSVDVSDEKQLEDLVYARKLLTDELGSILQNSIEDAVENKILNFISKHEKDTELKHSSDYCFGSRIERKVFHFYHFTSRRYDVEVQRCIQNIKTNKLRSTLHNYTESPSFKILKELIDSYKEVKESGMYLQEIEASIRKHVEKQLTEDRLQSAIETLKLAEVIIPDVSKDYTDRIIEPVQAYLAHKLDKVLENGSIYSFQNDYEKEFGLVTSLFSEEVIQNIKKETAEKIALNHSLELINYAVESDYHWISKENVRSIINPIISEWKYKDIDKFIIAHKPSSLRKEVKYELAFRAFNIIEKFQLDEPFSGETPEEYERHNYETCENGNVYFLNALSNLCTDKTLKEKWNKYINSLNPKQILILYKRGIVDSLPNDLIISIIENLSITDTYTSPEKWYSTPSFENECYKKIFEDPNIDIFTPITNYLQRMSINHENLYKAVWLVELLSANRPRELDYHQLCEWDNTFKLSIKKFKDYNSNNLRLSVLLWACYFYTQTNKRAMSEIFPWLPPYLQIKIVKRLFLYVSQKKMNLTAESMYKFLTSSNEPLCLPLEILFSYLKLREINPLETFTNAHMISLLVGREDHPEWIGIRELVDQCHGRWTIKHSGKKHWMDRYYNGLIKIYKDKDPIILNIYPKMIDIEDNYQKYNNKYFYQIQELIELHIKPEGYNKYQTSEGIEYHISSDYELEILYIAREYNLNCNIDIVSKQYTVDESLDDPFCECRMAKVPSKTEGMPFYWCNNKPCFRPMVRFKTDSEWEKYTVLDFLRILSIPIDYKNRENVTTKFGYYILFSSFLKNFAKFYDHLICKSCGKILHPNNISNFAVRAITEFVCTNQNCPNKGNIIYLNHCFNRPKCNEIIDSRNSKQCPNGQYICPKCGACCSTENFRLRLNYLYETGGTISPWLTKFVGKGLGHWEKQEFFCYKCGKPMRETSIGYKCFECNTEYSSGGKTYD